MDKKDETLAVEDEKIDAEDDKIDTEDAELNIEDEELGAKDEETDTQDGELEYVELNTEDGKDEIAGEKKFIDMGMPIGLGVIALVLVLIVSLVIGMVYSGAGDSNSEEESTQTGQTTSEDDAGAVEIEFSESVTESIDLVTVENFLDGDDYPEITALIQTYFDAYANCSLSQLMEIVDYNGGTSVTQDELDQRAEIVEAYQDLTCYLLSGMEDSSFVVYASYNIKFYNVSTPAPTLTRFYVTIGDDGVAHIYNGEVSEELSAYLNTVNEYDFVTELSDSVDAALQEACSQDSTLAQLISLMSGETE